jgi:hypothetical protein
VNESAEEKTKKMKKHQKAGREKAISSSLSKELDR